MRSRLPTRLADGDERGAAAARRRGGRTLRGDAGARAGPVQLVGVHDPAAGLAPDPGRPGRGGTARRAVASTTRRGVRRTGASERSPGSSRPTRGAGSLPRRAPTTSRAWRCGRAIDRLDFTSARQDDLAEMRREIYPLARRLATRMARERHAQTPRPAGLPAYRPRLGLDRRRPADHAPQAEAPAPHRAGRALRRQRLGGELRAVHADARLRPARAVREGPRLHLRRPGARGDRRLPARRRPRAT